MAMAGGMNPADAAKTTSDSHHQNVRRGVRRASRFFVAAAERVRRAECFVRSAATFSLTTVSSHQSHGTPVDTLGPLFETGEITRGHRHHTGDPSGNTLLGKS